MSSREELIKSLQDEKELSRKTLKFLNNMGVNQLIMTTRTVDDPANANYDPVYEYEEVDKFMAAEIVEAVKKAGFVFAESRESYFIRIFLVKLLSETVNHLVIDNYGLVREYENRVQFTAQRIERFWSILSSVLTPTESQALKLKLGINSKKSYSFEECAEIMKISKEDVKREYNVAVAKLWRDRAALKKYGFFWTDREEIAKKSEIAGRRLYRLLINGGYLEHPFVHDLNSF